LGFGEFHVVGAATEKPEKEKQLIGSFTCGILRQLLCLKASSKQIFACLGLDCVSIAI